LPGPLKWLKTLKSIHGCSTQEVKSPWYLQMQWTCTTSVQDAMNSSKPMSTSW
jgi:hypothetical protein